MAVQIYSESFPKFQLLGNSVWKNGFDFPSGAPVIKLPWLHFPSNVTRLETTLFTTCLNKNLATLPRQDTTTYVADYQSLRSAFEERRRSLSFFSPFHVAIGESYYIHFLLPFSPSHCDQITTTFGAIVLQKLSNMASPFILSNDSKYIPHNVTSLLHLPAFKNITKPCHTDEAFLSWLHRDPILPFVAPKVRLNPATRLTPSVWWLRARRCPFGDPSFLPLLYSLRPHGSREREQACKLKLLWGDKKRRGKEGGGKWLQEAAGLPGRKGQRIKFKSHYLLHGW